MPRRGFDLTIQMRKDLIEAYRHVYASCRSQEEAWQKTALQPAPRYYISPKRAYHVLIEMVKGNFGVVDVMPQMKRKMYYDLFREVQSMTQKTEFIHKSLWFICQFAVSHPAPEFYISIEALRKTINCCRKYGIQYHHKEVFCKSSR